MTTTQLLHLFLDYAVLVSLFVYFFAFIYLYRLRDEGPNRGALNGTCVMAITIYSFAHGMLEVGKLRVQLAEREEMLLSCEMGYWGLWMRVLRAIWGT